MSNDSDDPTPPGGATEPAPGSPTPRPTTSGDDPLRGSVTSGVWAALVAFGVLLVLLVIFVAQNTDPVRVRFLGLEGETPLAAALLIAVAGGLLLAALAGTLRLWQVRRRVRRDSKARRRED